MKIAILGANGRTGIELVNEALKRGFSVVAGVSANGNVFQSSPNLEVIEFNATAQEDVDALFRGCEAVISVLGQTKNSPKNLLELSMITVVTAMQKNNISKIVSLTGTGVRRPNDRISLIDRILNFGLGVVDGDRIKDGKKHLEVLERSGLDYTVLRVLKLTNDERQTYSLKDGGPAKAMVSRKTVAEALLRCLGENWNKKAPVLSD